MSASTDSDGYNAAQLRRMDEQTARSTLTVNQFERWEKLKALHNDADEQREEWEEDARVATETLVFSDASDLAVEVSVFGNDLACYYALDDPRIRETAERLGDIFDIDADADPEEIDTIHADEVDESDVEAVKSALVDLVLIAAVEWNGTPVDDLGPVAREKIRDAVMADPPEGWGVAGLMDAWTEIQTAVESERDERLERVRKFRQPERRGDR